MSEKEGASAAAIDEALRRIEEQFANLRRADESAQPTYERQGDHFRIRLPFFSEKDKKASS